MRSVDFQTVHTQTPAVERSYQTRPSQVEQELRQAEVLQNQAQDQKMAETQQSQATEQSKIHLEKEKEEQRRGKKKRKKGDQDQGDDEEQQDKPAAKSIDIRI